jgi:hypothetical protein
MTEPTTATTTTETAEAPPPAAKSLAEVAAEVWGEPAPEPEKAPEAPAAEAKPEPEKPAVEDEKQAATSARIAAAKRAELRAERERLDLKAKQDELTKLKADLDAREAEQKLIDEDPVKYFELKKLGTAAIKAHLEKIAGTFEPEKVADQKLSGLEKELADLKAELKRRDDDAAMTVRQREQAELEKEAGSVFIEHVTAAADKYPNLTAEFTEGEAIDLAFRELNAIVGKDSQGRPVTRAQAYEAEHGELPDNDVIAEYLDALAKQRIDARSKTAWRKRGEAPQARQADPNGDQNSAPPVKGTSPRTLSSRDTSQRAAAPKAAWSQEAADEESLRILEAAYRKHG